MLELNGKRILLGITGGIAAYKAAELVRLLRRSNAEVQVVMTKAATEFITPLTLQTLSGRTVRQDFFDANDEATIGHIDLARWADLILIAPATADFMARLAHGRANDLLSTLCLATTAPIALAPAMNRQMWLNPATQTNASLLQTRGVTLWGPAEGEQACGETGPGRMLEPAALLSQAVKQFSHQPLAGQSVLLTAGPTQEPIDPVRFIGNRSSGKMGFALAQAFIETGAQVHLIAGPVTLATPRGATRIDVATAHEMQQQVSAHLSRCNIFVACAAVADYRPETVAAEKIKKSREQLALTLIKNPDILAEVAASATPPFTVGFAAETEQLIKHAQEKRRLKRVDMIAANLVGAEQGGFERDENALTVLWEGGRKELPMARKEKLAQSLAATIIERYYAKKHPTENP
ncbi:MAG: bifunctional phosphopantothenoylcysteine decarboxylase/phosphopantothenate--cysteine ligase CoaBC [Candidatus Polarisedimenticolaceae bacterium]|nr:bifunctional phosphopantothenoylcysteine decarboxylase/phosphopantothenate--cysteine ligase CoaBC [Candidatus Polarisedimenticolaceae bacterium]